MAPKPNDRWLSDACMISISSPTICARNRTGPRIVLRNAARLQVRPLNGDDRRHRAQRTSDGAGVVIPSRADTRQMMP